MLSELSIKNFAIIDDITVNFENGLTVLTGETGAGKSIIIDAVQILTGARASTDFIRHGEDRAELVGLFSIHKNKSFIDKKAKQYDIDISDNVIILERVIMNNSNSVCRINHKIVTLTVLREFGQLLLHIHSQFDHIQMMDANTHLSLLDLYAKKEIEPIIKVYEQMYNQYVELHKKYNSLNDDEQMLAQRLDMLEFQYNEINTANLQQNEDELLQKEREELQNFEQLFTSSKLAYDSLYGEQKALEWIDTARKSLQNNKTEHDFIDMKLNELNSIYYNLEEISFDLSNFNSSLFYDEQRLNEIESRLNDINHLKRKYGESVNDILKYKNKIEQEINEIKNKEFHNEKLVAEMEQMKSNAEQQAYKLTKVRGQAAKDLVNEIKQELNELYLENTTFDVQFNKSDQMNDKGIDQVAFMMSTNKGEPLKPLNKIASGGEISRIMLAIRKIFAKHEQTPTVIFDEIDTGVSGRVAQAIAEKMYQISLTTQVLCITHLPQVAAMSDNHFLITKAENNERTSTEINTLMHDHKIEELAKMMTGTTLTKTAIEHSEQLLQLTDEFKNKINH